jgi:DHA2 family multidrug resistance protein
MLPSSANPETAAERGLDLLGLTVRKQAFTLAVADSFLVIAYAVTACLVVVACMSTLPLQYKQVTAQKPTATK